MKENEMLPAIFERGGTLSAAVFWALQGPCGWACQPTWVSTEPSHVQLLKQGSVLCCIPLEVLTCCLLSASPMPWHALPSVPCSPKGFLPLDVPGSTGLDLIPHSSFVVQTGCSAWRRGCSGETFQYLKELPEIWRDSHKGMEWADRRLSYVGY